MSDGVKKLYNVIEILIVFLILGVVNVELLILYRSVSSLISIILLLIFILTGLMLLDNLNKRRLLKLKYQEDPQQTKQDLFNELAFYLHKNLAEHIIYTIFKQYQTVIETIDPGAFTVSEHRTAEDILDDITTMRKKSKKPLITLIAYNVFIIMFIGIMVLFFEEYIDWMNILIAASIFEIAAVLNMFDYEFLDYHIEPLFKYKENTFNILYKYRMNQERIEQKKISGKKRKRFGLHFYSVIIPLLETYITEEKGKEEQSENVVNPMIELKN